MFTMHYLNRFGDVVFIREHVSAEQRMVLLHDPNWITAYEERT